jgi:ABC-type transporter Mla subunit MlaD
MKWDSTDLKVGLMVMGAVVVALVTFLWIGQQWRRDVAPLYTDVTDVQGIGVESPVFLNGFNVGRVSDVRPRVSERGELLFRVRMDILWTLEDGGSIPLRQGLRARVVPPALDIGRGSLVLELPARASVDLHPGDVIPSIQIGGTTNRMQLVVDSVGRDLRLVIAQVADLVKSLDATVTSASGAMRSANTVLGGLNAEMPGVLASVKSNLASADSVIRAMQAITPATVATLDSVRSLLGDSRLAVARATQFLDATQPQIASTLTNLDQASAVLNNMLKEVSRRPLRAITGVRPPSFAPPELVQAGTAATTKTGAARP